MGRRSIGRSRAGFTLIECLVALGIFVLMILLFRPLMNLAQSLTATDTEMSGVLTGARSLEHLTDNGTVSIDSMGKLTIQTSTDTYKVEQYSSTQVAKIVRVTTNHGGFMPVMRRVQKFSAVKIGAETVEYTVQTLSGKTFVGILMSRGGEQVEKKR